MGDQKFGIAPDVVARLADEIKDVHGLGVQMAVVLGGGNIIRGVSAAAQGIDRVAGDHMGLLATVINGLALQDALEKRSVTTRLMSAVEIRQIAEPFIRRRAMRHLEKNRVVLFVAGTGNPFFTTDSAAALRANEIHADVLLKATKVDGVYDADPNKVPGAKFLKTLTYRQALDAGPPGHGRRGRGALHGERDSDQGLQPQGQGQHPARRRRRRHRLAGFRRGSLSA